MFISSIASRLSPALATLGLAVFVPAMGAPADPVGAPDATFGPNATWTYGFQPVSNDVQDNAYGACERPDATLSVFGAASGNRRVVTARLRSDGTLDMRFSGDGKEAFELYAYGGFFGASLRARWRPAVRARRTQRCRERKVAARPHRR